MSFGVLQPPNVLLFLDKSFYLFQMHVRNCTAGSCEQNNYSSQKELLEHMQATGHHTQFLSDRSIWDQPEYVTTEPNHGSVVKAQKLQPLEPGFKFKSR